MDLFDVRYGFGYKMSLGDEPDCYASGIEQVRFTDRASKGDANI
jgi:hypothetical protein